MSIGNNQRPQVQGDVLYSYPMTTFGEWVSKELRQRKWIAADLAREAGLPNGTISRILSGDRGTGKKSIAAIAKAFDYPVGIVAEAAGYGHDRKGDNPASLKRLIEVARSLSDEELEELTYIALGKKERHAAKATLS